MFTVCLIILYFAATVVGDNFDDSSSIANVYVDVGVPANLTCVQPSATHVVSCSWVRLDLNGSTNLDLDGSARAMSTSNDVIDCAYELKNVTQEDLTLWKGALRWRNDKGVFNQICEVKLVRKVAPSYVRIQNKPELERLIDAEGSRNNTVTVKCCTDKAAAPPPELSIVFHGQVVQNTLYDEEESCLVWANATFSWGKSPKQLNCTLKHPMIENDLIDSMTLNVQKLTTTTSTTTTEAPKTTTETTEKPVIHQPVSDEKCTTTQIILFLFGLILGVILTLLVIFVAYKKGYFGTRYIPKSDREEQPTVYFQANPISSRIGNSTMATA